MNSELRIRSLDTIDLIERLGKIAYALNRFVFNMGTELAVASPRIRDRVQFISARCSIIQEQRNEALGCASRLLERNVELSKEFYSLVEGFVELSICTNKYLKPGMLWNVSSQEQLFELLTSYSEDLSFQFNSIRRELRNIERFSVQPVLAPMEARPRTNWHRIWEM